MEQGYTGISFPFRVGVKGGVVLSTTSTDDAQHIVESMQQILSTHPMERVMEYHVKSDLSTSIFDPNDATTRTLIAYEAEQSLRSLEDRVELLGIEALSKDTSIFVRISFKVKKYNKTYSTDVKVGELT